MKPIKINFKDFRKWIAALDSGKYSQTDCTLQDNDGYCCLGVGCKVIIPEEKQIKTSLPGNIYHVYGGMPEDQKSAPEWLKRINDHFAFKTGTSLSVLNDCDGFTFSEIATVLELVYIHKILD